MNSTQTRTVTLIATLVACFAAAALAQASHRHPAGAAGTSISAPVAWTGNGDSSLPDAATVFAAMPAAAVDLQVPTF